MARSLSPRFKTPTTPVRPLDEQLADAHEELRKAQMLLSISRRIAAIDKLDDALAALSRAGAGVLVSVLTFVALAKIHALVSPAEEDASQARVAEVFE